MTSPFNLRVGGVNLSSGGSDRGDELPPETPFRLLVCGNLSGNWPNSRPLEQRKPIEIDRDNFDDMLAKVAPSVTISDDANGAETTISFRELEDFEPDRLFRRLPVFEELRTLQDEVASPAKFAQAAAKIRAWHKVSDPESTLAPARPHVAAADLMREVLGETRARPNAASSESDDWKRFLASIVEPHLIAKPDPRQADYALVVEEAIGARMRAILHHRDFQALEAAWRSVHFLVKRLPTDERLKIFVLDAAQEEWRADLDQEDPARSIFGRVVNEQAADRPWAAVVALDIFGKEVADLSVLATMVTLSAQARTSVLAGVDPRVAGCVSLSADPDPRTWKPNAALAAAWEMIRGMTPSRFLGAVTPRFLLRLPYGKKAARTESFAFEELPSSNHDGCLWGSGAVACGLLLAEGFVASGWNLDLDDARSIDGLPVYAYDDGGESAVMPCAEVLLRESALEALMEQGLMVFTSIRERDGIRLARFHSATMGSEPLLGRW